MGEKVYTLRIDEVLFDKIKAIAEKNKRSVAKEIEYQLEQNLNLAKNEQVFDYIAKILKEHGANIATMHEIKEND